MKERKYILTLVAGVIEYIGLAGLIWPPAWLPVKEVWGAIFFTSGVIACVTFMSSGKGVSVKTNS